MRSYQPVVLTQSRYQIVQRLVLQSTLIHPDWDQDTHIAYLVSEHGFDDDDTFTLTSWPRLKPVTKTLYEFVGLWLKYPQLLNLRVRQAQEKSFAEMRDKMAMRQSK